MTANKRARLAQLDELAGYAESERRRLASMKADDGAAADILAGYLAVERTRLAELDAYIQHCRHGLATKGD